MKGRDIEGEIFDCLQEGYFPRTLLRVAGNGSIIVSRKGPSFRPLLEEIGDRIDNTTYWLIDPLPTARALAEVAFGWEFKDDGKTVWATERVVAPGVKRPLGPPPSPAEVLAAISHVRREGNGFVIVPGFEPIRSGDIVRLIAKKFPGHSSNRLYDSISKSIPKLAA